MDAMTVVKKAGQWGMMKVASWAEAKEIERVAWSAAH